MCSVVDIDWIAVELLSFPTNAPSNFVTRRRLQFLRKKREEAKRGDRTRLIITNKTLFNETFVRPTFAHVSFCERIKRIATTNWTGLQFLQ